MVVQHLGTDCHLHGVWPRSMQNSMSLGATVAMDLPRRHNGRGSKHKQDTLTVEKARSETIDILSVWLSVQMMCLGEMHPLPKQPPLQQLSSQSSGCLRRQ